MNTIIVEKECGCFKREGYTNNIQCQSKEEALTKALEMADEMNETFCKKHCFQVVENGDDIMIKMDMN